MSQNDMTIDNSTGANVRADINSALQAIATNNSGSSAPSTTFATQFFADTSAGIMKLRNTSNNGYVNLFTLAGGIDVDAASNFNEDVTFTGATSGRNIVFDKSDNQLEFADNAKASFGADADLTIHHNGNDSFITHHLAGSGNNFHIEAANSIQFGNVGTTEVLAQMVPNGGFFAFFDNSKKLETTSSGITVTGTVTETSDIAMKSDLKPLTNTLEKIQQITGYKYNLINSISPSMGVIAQDVEKVFPELVHGSEGKKTLQYSGLIGVLVEAVKDLSAKVEALEAS